MLFRTQTCLLENSHFFSSLSLETQRLGRSQLTGDVLLGHLFEGSWLLHDPPLLCGSYGKRVST